MGRLIPIGTRIIRKGYPHCAYHDKRGTVVEHDLNESNVGGCRYNIVRFDCDYLDGESMGKTKWVEGHMGVVPLDTISKLGEIADGEG